MTEQAALSPQWYRGREREKEEREGKGGKESISSTSVFLLTAPGAEKEVLLCSLESLYRFYGQLVQLLTFNTIPLVLFSFFLLSLLPNLLLSFPSFFFFFLLIPATYNTLHFSDYHNNPEVCM